MTIFFSRELALRWTIKQSTLFIYFFKKINVLNALIYTIALGLADYEGKGVGPKLKNFAFLCLSFIDLRQILPGVSA